MIASSFASFSPSRPALYLGNTFWKSDYPQVSCVARSNCKPTIDPVVCRRAACLTAEPNGGRRASGEIAAVWGGAFVGDGYPRRLVRGLTLLHGGVRPRDYRHAGLQTLRAHAGV